jgi:hypothetical protein
MPVQHLSFGARFFTWPTSIHGALQAVSSTRSKPATEELPRLVPVSDPVESPALDPALTPAPGTLPPPGRVVGRVSSRALPPVSAPVTGRAAPPVDRNHLVRINIRCKWKSRPVTSKCQQDDIVIKPTSPIRNEVPCLVAHHEVPQSKAQYPMGTITGALLYPTFPHRFSCTSNSF